MKTLEEAQTNVLVVYAWMLVPSSIPVPTYTLVVTSLFQLSRQLSHGLYTLLGAIRSNKAQTPSEAQVSD